LLPGSSLSGEKDKKTSEPILSPDSSKMGAIISLVVPG
jgi:hypothetical protein